MFPALMLGSSQLPLSPLQGNQHSFLISVDSHTQVTYTHRDTYIHAYMHTYIHAYIYVLTEISHIHTHRVIQLKLKINLLFRRPDPL